MVLLQTQLSKLLGQRGVGLRTGGRQGSSQSNGWRGTASLHLLEDRWSTAVEKQESSRTGCVELHGGFFEGGRDFFYGVVEARVWTTV